MKSCASLLAGLLVAVPAQAQTSEQLEFFEKRIRPLLVTHCYSCHSRDAKKLRGELYLDSRDGLRKGGATGPALVPGRPDESLLIKAVRHEGDVQMPPDKKLPRQDIDDLVAWVRMGAPDPRTGGAVVKASVDPALGGKFWSFQPVRDPPLPAVKDASWAASPVDRFILAALEQRGLRPVPVADRRTLIRRATFDLTGLPPTPEEIDTFLADNADGAFARLVERLLASPAYGERWGRHWLDVVRYADTAGDNSDYPIPQARYYRDWVIDAIQRDMPYDQFVRLQLAGDLLPASDPQQRREQLVATGYLAGSRRFGSYEDKRYPWHLTIEDTIDNLGKAFLGLTINCCRCHDHKFDPLPTTDYYALYGFFSSTRYPRPGIELEKMQHDFIPLATDDEIAAVTKVRQQRQDEKAAAIKQLEADRAGKKDKGEIDKLDIAIKAAKKERDRIVREPLPFETVYAVIDGRNEPGKRSGVVGNVRVQIKGDPDRLGAEVPRRFPLVLGGQVLDPSVKGSGRLELARWLTSPDNPLTARVMVNRIWQHHFDQGIVATPNNFGKLGQPPSHPELLDYLARRFVDSGWSLKAMHRLIMNSRVYQVSSSDDAANLEADVDNLLRWRYERRRLDAESIRDALLAVSGSLDRTPPAPHPFPAQTAWDFTQHKPFKAVYDSKRRSVYLMTQRIQRHPFLGLFDGPDTSVSTADRPTSTTPLQALFFMNAPFVHDSARQFAARLVAERQDEPSRVERAFLLALGRSPSSDERGQAHDFLAQVQERLRAAGMTSDEVTAESWRSFARALFMSAEFVYLN